tara:strand:- start:15 stop:797 length:783 start_codon:yes stop_codon:yes gene_type:complete
MEGTDVVIGTNLKNKKAQIRDDNINFLQRELGTSAYTSLHLPNFKLDLFEGTMSGSNTKFLTSNNTQTLQIPQINIELLYQYRMEHAASVAEMGGFEPRQGEYASEMFGDGKVFIIEEQNPIIRVNEYSSFDEKDNFEIKAYMVSSSSKGTIYDPLSFRKQAESIINGLLVEKELNPETFSISGDLEQMLESDPTQTETSYYFDLFFDREIPNEDLCRTIGDLEIKNIFLDEPLPCPDKDPTDFDIYATRISPDDLEDCD